MKKTTLSGKTPSLLMEMGPRNTILMDSRMVTPVILIESALLRSYRVFSDWSSWPKQDIFGSANARQCFIASGNPTSLSDARVCTDAIKYDNLSKRDLAATHTNRGIILAAGGRTVSSTKGPQPSGADKGQFIENLYK